MGACEGLKGMIYDCNNDQATSMKPANTYVQTTQALSIYMGSTCKNGMDIKSLIDHMQKPNFALPSALPAMADEGDKIKYKVKVDGMTKQENTYEENIGKLLLVILSQCTDLMMDKSETLLDTWLCQKINMV